MSFRRNLVKFAAVLSVFFTGISFINVPNQTQAVHAADQSTTEKREAVAGLAKKQVGKRYVYGATGPSAFDCSGLAQYVYKKAAIYVGNGQYVHAATPSQGVRKQAISAYFYPSAAKRVLN